MNFLLSFSTVYKQWYCSTCFFPFILSYSVESYLVVRHRWLGLTYLAASSYRRGLFTFFKFGGVYLAGTRDALWAGDRKHTFAWGVGLLVFSLYFWPFDPFVWLIANKNDTASWSCAKYLPSPLYRLALVTNFIETHWSLFQPYKWLLEPSDISWALFPLQCTDQIKAELRHPSRDHYRGAHGASPLMDLLSSWSRNIWWMCYHVIY